MDEKKKAELTERVIGLGKDEALEVAKSVLDFYKADLKGTEFIDELLEIGMDYDRLGLPEKALAIYLKAEKRARAIGDHYGLGTIYSNIGVLYNNTKDYKLALEYYEKSLKYLLEVNNEQEIGILYNNLGYVYKNIHKHVESVEYYHKSLKYLRKVDDKFSMTASYFNLAEVYAKLENYEEAVDYMERCIKIDRELNLPTLKEDIRYRDSLKAKAAERHGHKIEKPEIKNNSDTEGKNVKTGWLWGRKK